MDSSTSETEISSDEVRTEPANSAEQSSGIKIVSWNINGMRTLDMQEILKQLNSTILAVQETKLARKQLDQKQVIPSGYSSYFSFSTNRIGYSGVATFCRNDWTPLKAEEGLCLADWKTDGVGCHPNISEDEEPHVKHANADGRTVITQHVVMLPDGTIKNLTIINVYCPRLRDDPEDPTNNTEFKRTFHNVLHRRAKQLVETGSFVILLGDINISHRWIDQCDTDEKTFFVSEFRELLNEFLDEGDPTAFVDSYRSLHGDVQAAYTCWCTKLNARENNYGTRIDYIFVDKELAKFIDKAEIHSDVYGSDHCPISVTIRSLKPVSQKTPPSFATKFYPEFKGKQLNLKEIMSSSFPLKSTVKDRDQPKSEVKVSSKKRALETDPKSTSQNSKKVQMSLHSFFVKNNKKSETQQLPECKETENIESNQSVYQEFFESNNSNSQPEPKRQTSSDAWKKLMKAPEVPLCQGHQEPCARRTVKKKGVNYGREFWSCSHGIGKSDDPNANCNFFQWVKSTSGKK